jgi:hypothetical protein
VHLGLKDYDAAVAALELAVEQRNALAWWPKSAAQYDPLRSHPRFDSVISKIVPA